MVARSSWLAMSSSYQRRRMTARSLAVSAAHPGKAALAASIARRVSGAPMLGTVPSAVPVAGFSTSWVASPASQRPPISARPVNSCGSLSFISGPRALGALAGDVARDELERARARERGSLRVIALALIAVEAVAGALVYVQRRRRLRCSTRRLHVTRGDALVLAAEVIKDRAARLLLQIGRHLAVIDRGTGEGQLAGGEVG